MDKKDKIKLDFDFLDKNTVENGDTSNVNHKKSNTNKGKSSQEDQDGFKLSDSAKKWLTGFAVVGVIIFIGVISDDSSTSNTGSTNTSNSSVSPSQYDDLVQTGEYWCSRYHHTKAGELEPSVSEGSSLDAKTAQLASEGDELDSEKYEIENMYVDEYSQWSIDQYNYKIDSFNEKLEDYRYRAQMHERNIDSYNSRVQTYNNYLTANCSPSR